MFPYPAVSDGISAIQGVIAIVTTKTAAANRAQLGKDGWIVAGVALGQTLGEPGSGETGKFTAMAAAPDLTDEQACDQLRSVVEANTPGDPTKMMALNINWAAILKWVLAILPQVV